MGTMVDFILPKQAGHLSDDQEFVFRDIVTPVKFFPISPFIPFIYCLIMHI